MELMEMAREHWEAEAEANRRAIEEATRIQEIAFRSHFLEPDMDHHKGQYDRATVKLRELHQRRRQIEKALKELEEAGNDGRMGTNR